MRWAGKERSTAFLKLALGILIASSLFLFLEFRQFQEQNNWVWHTQKVLEQSESLLSLIKDAETGQRGYLLTRDQLYLQPYTTAVQVIKPKIQALRQLTADNPTQQMRINAVEPLLAAKLAELKQTIRLTQNQNLDAALQVVKTNKGKQVMDQIRQLIAEIKTQENRLLQQRLDKAQLTAQVMSLAIIICSLSTFSLIILTSFLWHQDRKTRQRVEQELRASEVHMRLALLAADMGTWEINLLTGEAFESDRAKSMFGLPPEHKNFNLDEWRSLLYPDDRERVAGELQDAIAGNSQYNTQYRIAWTDGTIHWLAAQAKVRCDQAGKPVYIVGVITDITERKQAEEVLLEREAELRMALEASHMGIWNWNLITNQITWSKGHEQLFGLEVGSFDGTYKTFEDRIHPDDRSSLNQVVSRAIEERTDYHHEFCVIWKDGSIHWIEGKGRAFYDEAGQAVRMAGTVMDISERKQAEAQIRTLNAQLEQRVLERTAQLTQANQELTKEISERKRAEEALQKHAEEIYDLYNNAPCGYHSIDPEGTFIRINDTELKWLGYTRDEVINKKKFSDLLTPESLLLFQENFPKFKEQGWINNLEFQLICKDGKILTASINSTALKDNAGNYLMSRSTLFDISELKRVESALRRREQEFKTLAENAQDIICRFDRQLRHVYINPIIEQETGIPVQSFIGKTIYEMNFPQEFVDSMASRFHEVFATGEIRFAEFTLFGPHGLKFYQTCDVPEFAADGSVESILSRVRDITPQKQFEASLRESERRWRSLLENVRLVVVGLDNTGKVEFVNPFFLELTGYTQAEVQGKNWFETFLPLSEQQQLSSVFQELLEQEFHPYYQNAILTKSGEERIIAWNNTRLKNLQDEVIGTMSIGEDITERYAIEKMKNEFVSVVSHELRTPLTSIRGSLGMLRTGLLDKHPERMKRMIEIAAIDTERLVRLVNDILDLERLESGKVTLVRDSCDASALIMQSADAMRSLAQKENIALSISPISALVWADSDQILQALTNLLSNAIKFSPPECTITLTTQVQADYVLFQVKDQGRGIPPDKLESIFGRFQQVDSSDSRQKGGTGLGLAICQSIITQHGGRIWAESVLGEGSTFSFTLPVSSN